jgi:hypothetical protein
MKRHIALILAAALAAGGAYADEKKADAKKAAKAKPAEKKSDKNVFQKTESSVGDWAHRNKIWTRSEHRGTGEKKKPAKKAE